eukprot:scaffold1424_cov237-Pinguiococcus_pyrenoidosus.AAC.14
MVGVPGQAALQKFLIDSAMSKPNAEPNPTEERKLSAAERLQMTRSLALIAGNANLEDGVKTQMEAAFKPQLEKLPIAPAAGAEDAVKAVRTATKYVSNALTDAKKFGTIPTSAAAFKATVASFPGLPSVLVTMGFEQKDDKLVLGHRNRAKLAIGLSTLNAWIVKANKAKQEADLKNRVIQLARKKKEEARAAKNGGNVAKKASKAPEDDGAKAAARAVKDPVSKPTAAAKKHEKNGGAEAQKAAAGVKDADKDLGLTPETRAKPDLKATDTAGQAKAVKKEVKRAAASVKKPKEEGKKMANGRVHERATNASASPKKPDTKLEVKKQEARKEEGKKQEEVKPKRKDEKKIAEASAGRKKGSKAAGESKTPAKATQTIPEPSTMRSKVHRGGEDADARRHQGAAAGVALGSSDEERRLEDMVAAEVAVSRAWDAWKEDCEEVVVKSRKAEAAKQAEAEEAAAVAVAAAAAVALAEGEGQGQGQAEGEGELQASKSVNATNPELGGAKGGGEGQGGVVEAPKPIEEEAKKPEAEKSEVKAEVKSSRVEKATSTKKEEAREAEPGIKGMLRSWGSKASGGKHESTGKTREAKEQKKEAKKASKQTASKSATLASAGLLGGIEQGESNEYFGGDSTVFLSGESEDEKLSEDAKDNVWGDDSFFDEDEESSALYSEDEGGANKEEMLGNDTDEYDLDVSEFDEFYDLGNESGDGVETDSSARKRGK